MIMRRSRAGSRHGARGAPRASSCTSPAPGRSRLRETDGSGRCDGPPATSRGACRNAGSPHSRNANRWARSGTSCHHSEERPDGHLVDPDEHQAGASHVRAPWCRAADVSAVDRAERRVRTASRWRDPAGSRPCQPRMLQRIGAIAARSRRRARLRLTAPLAPGTAKATRETAASPGIARIRTAPDRDSLPGLAHRRNPASPGKAMPRVHRVGAEVARRLRPFRRRALSTWRPPGVAMRMRKPCVLRRYSSWAGTSA